MSTSPDHRAAAGAAGAADWAQLETEIRTVPPKALKPQTVNARYMTAAQMAQLVENIRRDGKLTSLPLAYLADDGSLETLSGHHRAEAADKAGLETIDVVVITTRLTHQRKTAIQLSHNAVTGQDDPTTLASMFMGLDLSAKTYSGLDDSCLDALKDVKLAGLSIGVQTQELKFFFLPQDAEAVAEVMDDLDKAAKRDAAYCAAYADFNDFFDLVVRAKSKFGAASNATALRMLVDVCRERLDQMDAEAPADGD